MKNSFFFLIFLIQFAFAQDINVLTFKQFQKKLKKEKAEIIILNFWATWCKPCVEELPDFERIYAEYKDKNVKVMLVSLDFASDLETNVKPFWKSKGFEMQTYLLNESDPNKWINQIEPKWSGAMPATFVYYKRKQIGFVEGKITEKWLKEKIETKK
jgi:thiol-disulfide isomerase/thioredoxin